MDERIAINHARWEERVPIHVASRFYDVPGFLAGRCSLRTFEVDEVGDVSGQDLLHLQCHFGMDTLSWARRGARVTGLDFSGRALAEARRLAAQTGLADRATFVESTVADAPRNTLSSFDAVYTSWGALGWLPELDSWAETIAAALRPGGRFYIAESHPIWDAYDEDEDGRIVERYTYGGPAPVELDEPGTYADPDAATVHNRSVGWSHGLGEIISVLAGNGLRIEFLRERPMLLWPRFAAMVEGPSGEWTLPGSTLPQSFSLLARQP